MALTNRRKVAYFYDPDVGNYYYAQGHPMKPHRVRMTHNLLLSYGLLNKMDVLATPRATPREMTRFHSDEYIKFLSTVAPEVTTNNNTTLCRFNVLEDCPVFDGLWEYCQIAAGGSLAGATRLNDGDSNAAINWAGGLHHAKKAEASGFCYINDCVLAILELLKVHARVLYVDIDIHHGDGVEEAFYTTDRVMTASFHKFGDYFPGTGDVTDVGVSRGKHYAANFPLRDGITDDCYREIFVPVMSRIMEWYRPGAVVLQCGADSLSGDRLGCFNLSLLGHAQCVDFFKRYDTPLLLLGGGGYTIRNVARCWVYETSRLVGETLSDEIPFNENYEFYGPEFRLHITPSNMENHNSQAELQQIKMRVFENLRYLPHAPSVPMIDTPRVSPIYIPRLESNTNTATIAADDDELDPDVRKRSRRHKIFVDYVGSDDEFDDQYISSLRHARQKYKRISFTQTRNPSAVLSPDHEKLPSSCDEDDAPELNSSPPRRRLRDKELSSCDIDDASDSFSSPCRRRLRDKELSSCDIDDASDSFSSPRRRRPRDKGLSSCDIDDASDSFSSPRRRRPRDKGLSSCDIDDAPEVIPSLPRRRAQDKSLIQTGKNHPAWTPAKGVSEAEINHLRQQSKKYRGKINGGIENSRQTVSGMSNFREVESTFGQSRRRDRLHQDSVRSVKDGERTKEAHADSRKRFAEHRASQIVDEKITDNIDTNGSQERLKLDRKLQAQGRRARNSGPNGGISGDPRLTKTQTLEMRKAGDSPNVYNHTEFSDQGHGRGRQYSVGLKDAFERSQKTKYLSPKEPSSWKKESWSGNDEIQAVTRPRPTESADSRVKQYNERADNGMEKDGNTVARDTIIKEETMRPFGVVNLISKGSDGIDKDQNSDREVAGDSQSEIGDRDRIDDGLDEEDRNEADRIVDGDDEKEAAGDENLDMGTDDDGDEEAGVKEVLMKRVRHRRGDGGFGDDEKVAAGDENLDMGTDDDDDEEAGIKELHMKRLRRRRGDGGFGNSVNGPLVAVAGAGRTKVYDLDDGGRSREAMSSAKDVGDGSDGDVDMKPGSRDDNLQRGEQSRNRRSLGIMRDINSRNRELNDGEISDSMDNVGPQSMDRWKRYGGRRRSAIVDDVSGSEHESERIEDGDDDGGSDFEDKMNVDGGWKEKERRGRLGYDSDDGDVDKQPVFKSRGGVNATT